MGRVARWLERVRLGAVATAVGFAVVTLWIGFVTRPSPALFVVGVAGGGLTVALDRRFGRVDTRTRWGLVVSICVVIAVELAGGLDRLGTAIGVSHASMESFALSFLWALFGTGLLTDLRTALD